jgi:hypothetical protein
MNGLTRGFIAEVGSLPIDHLIVLFLVVLVVIAFIFFMGIELNIGDKKLLIGGFLKIMNRRDKENLLREDLRRKIDDIDHTRESAINNIIDEVVMLEEDQQKRMLIGSALIRAVRFNNLENNLDKNNIKSYIVRKMAESKGMFGDSVEWQSIFAEFTNLAKAELVKSYQAKIATYEDSLKLFKNKASKELAVLKPLVRNQEKLAKMG